MSRLNIEINPLTKAYRIQGDLGWDYYNTLVELKQQLIQERADRIDKWIDESPTEKMRKHRIEMSKNGYLKEEDITFFNIVGYKNIII